MTTTQQLTANWLDSMADDRSQAVADNAADLTPTMQAVLALYDSKGMCLRGGDVVNAILVRTSSEEMERLLAYIETRGVLERPVLRRWLGGAIWGELRYRRRAV